jgi:cytosine/adenosine deaminase-related metal-dependent hydrolase
MPGFIDTHHHMWEGAFRSSGTDQMLNDYFLTKLVAMSPHLTPEDVYIANRLSALAARNAGITTTLDWSHIANSPAHTDAAIAALKDTGTRAVYAYAPSMNCQGEGPNPYPQDIFRLRRGFVRSCGCNRRPMALQRPAAQSTVHRQSDPTGAPRGPCRPGLN